MRTTSGASPRSGMKSVTRTEPEGLSHCDSRIEGVAGVAPVRALLCRRAEPAASGRCSRRRAGPRSTLRSRTAGTQSQSIEPSRADQRGRQPVTDQRVVLDASGHAHLPNVAWTVITGAAAGRADQRPRGGLARRSRRVRSARTRSTARRRAGAGPRSARGRDQASAPAPAPGSWRVSSRKPP